MGELVNLVGQEGVYDATASEVVLSGPVLVDHKLFSEAGKPVGWEPFVLLTLPGVGQLLWQATWNGAKLTRTRAVDAVATIPDGATVEVRAVAPAEVLERETLWAEIIDPPASLPPEAHTHPQVDVDNLLADQSVQDDRLTNLESYEPIQEEISEILGHPGFDVNPSLQAAAIDAAGTTLTLTFTDDVVGNVGFTLTADGNPRALSAPGGGGPQITFTCEQVGVGQVCLLSYTAGDVKDLIGRPLLDFANRVVTNGSIVDITPPQLVSAVVETSGTTLTLTFDEDVTGNTGFTLNVGGQDYPLSAPGGAGTQITFTCDLVFQGEACLLSYVPGNVQDDAGNPLAGFANTAVTNNSTVLEIPPVLVSATVDAAGTTLTLLFNENVQGNIGFTLTADAVGIALSAPSNAGDTITFTCEQILYEQACLLSYSPGNVENMLNTPLAGFVDNAVTNDSVAGLILMETGVPMLMETGEPIRLES